VERDMKMGKIEFANKFREIRKSLDDFKEADDIDSLRVLIDKKIEWILNVLIIWFDDKEYPNGMKELTKND
jgi:hypothetical protein